jgi:hypothetical protein
MDDLQLARFAQFGLQFLFRTRDREHLIVQKLLDADRDLDIAPAVTPLTRAVLLRRQHWKLGFPIPEYVRLHTDEVAHFADLKVDFLRYYDSWLSHAF